MGFVMQLKLVFSEEKRLVTTAFARPLVRKVAGAVYLRNYSQILTIYQGRACPSLHAGDEEQGHCEPCPWLESADW